MAKAFKSIIFEDAQKLDSQNIKVIRNIRALRKVKSEQKISNIQWCVATVLFSGVIVTLYLFMTKMLTENVFAVMFIILIAMLIFILFYHQLDKFKAGPIEFEKKYRAQEPAGRCLDAIYLLLIELYYL